MHTVCWTLRRERPLSTDERLVLQQRHAAAGRERFELFLTPGGPVVAAGRHRMSCVDEVLSDLGAAAQGLGVDVVVRDEVDWPASAVATDELRALPQAACAQVLMALDRGEAWARRALVRFGPEDVVEAWLGHYRVLHGAGATAGWQAAVAVGAESYASRVLALWDAADNRSERASIRTLLQCFMAVPAVEDRLCRDYLYSVRSGDRYLAEILEPGSPRVVAVYAQVILRRLRKGRGIARYAVRHLARRGDGLPLLGAVLGSKQFLAADKNAVLEACDPSWWTASVAMMADRFGALPRVDDERMSACLVHPEALVRRVARQMLRAEGQALALPMGTWEQAIVRYGQADLERLTEEGEAWGQALLDTHGQWLASLEKLPAQIDVAPKSTRPRLETTAVQTWDGELLTVRVAPAPASTKPRLELTLRDASGCIVDLVVLPAIRFDGTVAVFEAWLLGRRADAVTASATLV